MLFNCFGKRLPKQADKAVGRERLEFTEVSSIEYRGGDNHRQ